MYAKLFTSIYQGTLRGNSHGLLVFTNLLAHADSAGVVDIHPRAIADEVGLTEADVRVSLLMLEAPDGESRTPDMEGRRITRTDEHRTWGWLIVNYAKYRAIRNEEDRREQNRLAQQRWREKNKPSRLTPADCAHESAESAQAEAEAEVEAKAKNTKPQRKSASRLASEWAPGPGGFAYAQKLGLSMDRIGTELEAFKDWWAAAPGSKGLKADWDATWRTWCRKASESKRQMSKTDSIIERNIAAVQRSYAKANHEE